MTPQLENMTQAFDWCLRKQVEIAPPRYRANAEVLARLEAADYHEQLMRCDSEAERVALSRRWINAVHT